MVLFKHGQEVEASGELVELTPRFYAEGWGWGSLRMGSGRIVKITGVLQGRSVGENLLIKGVWNEQGKYGPQLEAAVILLDVQNGTTAAIKAWLRKVARSRTTAHSSHDPELYERLMAAADAVCGFVDPPLRWETLASEAALCALNIPDATLIAEAARQQLRIYRKMRQLQEWGFTDREIHKLGEERILDLEEAKDIYELVTEPPSFNFYRLDSVASNAFQVDQMDDARVRAGLCWTMKKAHEEGHTAMTVPAFAHEAAEVLQIYPNAVLEWLLVQDLEHLHEGNSQSNFLCYKNVIQTAAMAGAEQRIANFVIEACEHQQKLEKDRQRYGA